MRDRIARAAAFAGVALVVGLAAPAWAAQSECDKAFQGNDWPAALFSCERLAKRGDAPAQLIFGTMYLRGQGVSINPAEAARWYRRAAEQGNSVAQTELGVMYAAGIGVRQDYVLAHMWLNLAASAPVGGQRAADKRDLIERSMLPVEVTNARIRAEEWKNSHGKLH